MKNDDLIGKTATLDGREWTVEKRAESGDAFWLTRVVAGQEWKLLRSTDEVRSGVDRSASAQGQVATITSPGDPGRAEPYAMLADGRTMPMGWNHGKTYEIGTEGVAEYLVIGNRGLWKFVPDSEVES